MKERPSVLLLTSAVIYFAAALPLIFAPEELLSFFGGERSTLTVSLLQVIGSALFGFAMLNWMQRYSRIGGIFGRPIVAANFAHSATAALLLGHIALRASSALLLVILGVYGSLAVAFGAKFFLASPASPASQQTTGS